MRRILTKKRKMVIVDDADRDFLRGYSLRVGLIGKRWYAFAFKLSGSREKDAFLHRVLLGLAPGDRRKVDHKNGNGLDNRRSNLRLATNSQNCANRGKQSNNTSGYKGVFWSNRDKLYEVKICRTYVGGFKDPISAAKAYDAAAIARYGEFAKTNF